ncbi:copper chaperone PCu(A)C [uncultured Oxalicibacterium sp.]|uniref:copper chaperone PCu(A)C n=1 Tax=uncultured Oxalicibacterium sp. TaxID=1168540 RepID=UPI0025EE4432|nr:copper chaperone PCu(A)C [uncultured Oxalicibacterium sp.]
MKSRLLTLAFAASLFAPLSYAQTAQGIVVDQGYARATVPGQTSGGAYLTLENKGKHADALLSAQSSTAQSVELHTMKMEGDVMRMREVNRIDLAAGEKVSMAPSKGYHIMLMGLKAPLKAGDKVPLTLQFEKAGKQETLLEVRDGKATADNGKHGEHHKH